MQTPLNGYITLFRIIMEWEWADDDTVFAHFVKLIIAANYQDKKWQGITVKRGSLVGSIDTLCTRLRTKKSRLRRSLDVLSESGAITVETVPNKYHIITIVNYNKYQPIVQAVVRNSDNGTDNSSDNRTDNRAVNSADNSSDNRTDTTKEVNKERIKKSKNIKNVVVSESCKKVFELFNQTCFSLDSIENPTDLNIRRVSELLQQHPDFNFYDYFIRVEKSDFITGRNGRWNIGGTKATFDWILNSKNIAKIQSGQFDNAEEVHNGTHSGSNEEEDREIDFSKLGEWF